MYDTHTAIKIVGNVSYRQLQYWLSLDAFRCQQRGVGSGTKSALNAVDVAVLHALGSLATLGVTHQTIRRAHDALRQAWPVARESSVLIVPYDPALPALVQIGLPQDFETGWVVSLRYMVTLHRELTRSKVVA